MADLRDGVVKGEAILGRLPTAPQAVPRRASLGRFGFLCVRRFDPPQGVYALDGLFVIVMRLMAISVWREARETAFLAQETHEPKVEAMRQAGDLRGSVNYVVEPDEQHWTVSCGGERCGWFGDRKSALKSAVVDARRVRVRGFPISVHVRRHDGSVRRLPEPLIQG